MRKPIAVSVCALSVAVFLMTVGAQAASLLSLYPDYPKVIFDQTGRVNYTASDGLFAVTAMPIDATFSTSEGPKVVNEVKLFRIALHLDATGAIAEATADDLLVQGRIAGINDDPASSDTLLKGTVVAFGYSSTGSAFNFQFQLTGGLLAGRFAGQLARVEFACEGSTFNNADGLGFTRDFTGGAKGEITAMLSLGDRVWADNNSNGLQDAGEPGLPNVAVNLYKSGNPPTLLRSTTTDASGYYVFANLQPTNPFTRSPQYVVEFVRPETGYTTFSPQYATGPDASFTNNTDSNADPATGRTSPVGLAIYASNMTLDAGLYKLPQVADASLGDRVWQDLNANGIQDDGEPGIPGVTVNLLDAAGQPTGATAITDANGLYKFENLAAGTYAVQFVAPAGYVFTTPDQGDDAHDCDANPTTGQTGLYTLVAGQYDDSVDAGLYQLAALGDRVWEDLDGDGIQDACEPGIANVTVNLYDAGNTLKGTTTTDACGMYLFVDLAPGAYIVAFVQPAGYIFSPLLHGTDRGADSNADPATGRTAAVTLLSGQSDLTIDAGLHKPACLSGYVYVDYNGNGVKDCWEKGIPGVTVTLTGTDNLGNAVSLTTTTNCLGAYSFGNLRPGTYTLTETQPDGYMDGDDTVGSLGGTLGNDVISEIPVLPGDAGINYNFGEILPASLLGYVYVDCNNNGRKDAGEAPIAGVTVALTGYDIHGDLVRRTTTTDGSGFYSFNDLLAGIYMLEETQPDGYLDGKDNAGSLGGIAGNDEIWAILVKPGDAGVNYDFGEIAPSSLSGYVYGDLDDNGLFEPTRNGTPFEEGIAGVTVTLYLQQDLGWTQVAQVVTDDGGLYTFDNLLPGTYKIVETQPADWSDGRDTVGTIDGQIVGSASANDVFSCIVISHCGQAGINYNFGERGDFGLHEGCTGTIGFWANKNGQRLIRLLGACSPGDAGKSTALGNWLASNFPNMYGKNAGSNDFSGKTTAYIADRFVALKNTTGQKLDAQVLAVALAVYTTTTSLNKTSTGQSFAMQHGFVLASATDPDNLANALWNVGDDNEAFGVPAYANVKVMDLLLQANAHAASGVLWPEEMTVNGVAYSATTLRNQANTVFSAINEAGDIP